MPIFYRKARPYQLTEDYVIQTVIKPQHYIKTDYIELSPSGMLTIKANYTWDGPSGPAFDTKNFMRPSLVHDAFYQLMRAGLLSQAWREKADELMYQLCRQNGMWPPRAWWCYKGVREFAAYAAKRQAEYQISVAP